MPDYDFSEGKVKATLPGCIISEDFARLLQQDSELPLQTVLALDKVQKQLPLSDEEWKDVKSRALVEGKKTSPYLSHSLVELLDNDVLKEQYVQNKAFDNDYYKKLLLTYLEEWGTTSRSKINALIENKLPDFLTPEQKRKKIANLLLRLKQAGKITLTERNEWKLIQNSN